LTRRERRAELTSDLPDVEIDAVEATRMAAGFEHLDAELDVKR
jgi:hypothetical protein